MEVTGAPELLFGGMKGAVPLAVNPTQNTTQSKM